MKACSRWVFSRITLGDVAAEVVHELEQRVPEGGGAEAGDDGEIAADLGDGAADGAAANLTLEILQCGHEEFGIVPAGGQRRAWRGFGPGWLVCWWLGLGVRWCGRWFVGAGAAGHDFDVSAGFGAREEHVLQRGGAQDASVEVGEDGGEVGGAEACRDGGECGGGGAVADGGEEMAAVAEQDADGAERRPRCTRAWCCRADPVADREARLDGSCRVRRGPCLIY